MIVAWNYKDLWTWLNCHQILTVWCSWTIWFWRVESEALVYVTSWHNWRSWEKCMHSFIFHAIKENGKSKISPKKWKNIKYFMVCAWLTGLSQLRRPLRLLKPPPTHVKRERSASTPAELEPPTIVINDHDDDVLSLTRRAGFAGRVLSASMHSCWVHCSHFWMESAYYHTL